MEGWEVIHLKRLSTFECLIFSFPFTPAEPTREPSHCGFKNLQPLFTQIWQAFGIIQPPGVPSRYPHKSLMPAARLVQHSLDL